MSKAELPTRDRIVLAAGKLFHQEGIRAVSMDAVAERTGVTKRTLYYHFRSKDDLIAAHLEARDQPNLALFQQWFDASEGTVADKIRRLFAKLAQAARHPKWKGCGFLRTSVELINLPGHPAILAGRLHKKRVEDWFCAILDPSGQSEPARQTARQLILLLDGAFSVVLLHRDASYMESAGEAAANLVRSLGETGHRRS
ncbi:TetR/AcrR family transcriptional regulator [Shinella sp. M27]|uniref:TetR/AcrR family transcriptional regulator n=1 Tax=Shinella sp. M27 TaxID=3368614 RepID=UPI003BA32666